MRASYRITARSVAHDARIDVSTWLNLTSVMVSIALCSQYQSYFHEAPKLTDGHTRLDTGAPEVLEVSYMDMTLEPAAKVGSERWCETDVKAELPCHVAFGGDLDGWA